MVLNVPIENIILWEKKLKNLKCDIFFDIRVNLIFMHGEGLD